MHLPTHSSSGISNCRPQLTHGSHPVVIRSLRFGPQFKEGIVQPGNGRLYPFFHPPLPWLLSPALSHCILNIPSRFHLTLLLSDATSLALLCTHTFSLFVTLSVPFTLAPIIVASLSKETKVAYIGNILWHSIAVLCYVGPTPKGCVGAPSMTTKTCCVRIAERL